MNRIVCQGINDGQRLYIFHDSHDTYSMALYTPCRPIHIDTLPDHGRMCFSVRVGFRTMNRQLSYE